MKKILLIASISLACSACYAQQTRDAQIAPATQPVNNPNQVPNYYQNNSSYNNNSLQNNKPANPNAATFQGNGTYVDPSRVPAGSYLGSSTNQLPGQGPVNSANSNGVNAGTGSATGR